MNRLDEFARKVGRNNTRTCFVLKCDIKKFFSSIDQNILINLIEKRIRDRNTIWLIKEIIKSFSDITNKGLPLGNITSQLFANIYLNELDQFIKHKLKVKYYIRYCDDFVVLNTEKGYLKELILQVNNFLKERLKLFLHQDKVIIRKHHQGIDFLGYVSFPYYRILRTKTKKRMFKKIRVRIKGLNQNKISKKSFNQTIQSYLGVLKHCNSHKLKRKIKKLIYD